MSVIPSTTDDEDIRAAKMGDSVLKSFWHNDKMRKKVRELGGWIFGVGNAFLDDQWDKKLGSPQIGEDGKLYYPGDATVGVWNPFEIVVPFAALGDTELHRFPWLIKAKFRSLEWIAGRYKNGDKVAAEVRPGNYTNVNQIMGAFSGTSSSEFPGAMVIELYLQPNQQFPKGLFLVGANGVVLEKQDYPFTEYSLEHFKAIDVPGVFWGTCDVDQGIGLQKTWNQTISSIDEFNHVCAKGKGLTPRGAKLGAAPDNSTGEWLEYNPVLGRAPEWMRPPNLSPSVTLSLQITKQSLEDLFSQHEVSRGTNKSDIRSGVMAGLLREQDSHGAVPTHAVFEEGLEGVMGRVLKRVQVGYTTERMLKVRGQDGDFEVFAFKGADLRDNTDVAVKRDSTMPDSRTLREAQILERYQAGLYGNIEDPQVRLKVSNLLEDAVVQDINDEMRLDEVYARWENMSFLQSPGDQYLVNDYDDHAVHIREHNKLRKSVRYQRLKVDNPGAFGKLELVFAEHVKTHQEFVNQQMEAQIAQQIRVQKALKGGTDG